MILQTATEGISLARQLENDSASFYESLAKKIPANAEFFLACARENKKFITQFERAYYGVITDAIEGCFAFNLNTDEYILKTGISAEVQETDIIRQAVELEDKITRFYTDAAHQSDGLMADLPRMFKIIARKREERKQRLNSLLA